MGFLSQMVSNYPEDGVQDGEQYEEFHNNQRQQ